jgi:hypothetical protein
MNESLILDSLEIRNFRVFRYLCIERLGRVNLIAGKNNVGKTCLLEALWLYARRGYPQLIGHLLEVRDELDRLSSSESIEYAEALFGALTYLFHGRQSISEQTGPIQIGPCNVPSSTLSITLKGLDGNPPSPKLAISLGTQLMSAEFSLGRPSEELFAHALIFEPMPHRFVAAEGLSNQQTGRLWDDITLTDLQDDVLTSLRIIAPEVEGVGFRSRRKDSDKERIPIARITGLEHPIPLRSLGEGTNRMFGIALALVNAKDGLLLVDEIDSGLHYSVQPDLWRLVFQVARRLNVQVFATTHSWDCIEGFQKAASEDEKAEGVLISLREKGGDIEAVLFDERELEIATREKIEVR